MSVSLVSDDNNSAKEDDDNPFACFDNDTNDQDDDDNKAGQVANNKNPNTRLGFGVEHLDSNSNSNNNNKNYHSSATAKRRNDNNCGVMRFHIGTESALLQHIRMKLFTESANHRSSMASIRPVDAVISASLALSQQQQQQQQQQMEDIIQRAERILSWMDDFSWERHWMMHIGPSKASVLERFLIECFHSKRKKDFLSSATATTTTTISTTEEQ
jgi:hypothetical protein